VPGDRGGGNERAMIVSSRSFTDMPLLNQAVSVRALAGR